MFSPLSVFRARSIKRNFQKIRTRQRIGNKIISEQMRESRAREYLARKKILPMLKKHFGKDLVGVVIIGSSQRQLRRSRTTSDVDVWAVFDDRKESSLKTHSREWKKYWNRHWSAFKLHEGIEKKFGIRCEIGFSRPKEFGKIIMSKSWEKEPFQIIYGEKNINQILERHLESENPKKTLQENLAQRTTGEYKSRPNKGRYWGN
jgi:hypothetical protein